MQLYHQIIHGDLERPYYKITNSKKIKTIDNKIEQNKAQCNLDRQTAKISVLSSRILVNMKDVLPEKDLLESTTEFKRFEYSPLGNKF